MRKHIDQSETVGVESGRFWDGRAGLSLDGRQLEAQAVVLLRIQLSADRSSPPASRGSRVEVGNGFGRTEVSLIYADVLELSVE